MVANSEAIKKIDNEIEKMQDASLKADLEKEDKKLENKKKKCRYSNSGHCKYKMDCKFSHPKEVCKIYFAGGGNVPKNRVKTDIQRCVNGHKEKVAVRD